MPRFFVNKENISEGIGRILGDDARHIARSLRMAVGDKITVSDGEGVDYMASLSRIRDEECLFEILGVSESRSESPVSITLYVAYPKGDKLETVIQKAVELGASEIIAVMSERCVSRPDGKAFEKRLERLGRISESAAAQCGREFVPAVRGIISYREAIDEMKESGTAFVCYEGDGTVAVKGFLTEKRPTSFLIGPEGGLSQSEVDTARENGIGLANLGRRILRTETASGYVLSAISVLLED